MFRISRFGRTLRLTLAAVCLVVTAASQAAEIIHRYGGRQILIKVSACQDAVNMQLKSKVKRVKIHGRLLCGRDASGNPQIMVALRGGGYVLRVESNFWVRVRRLDRRHAITVGNIFLHKPNAKTLEMINRLELMVR